MPLVQAKCTNCGANLEIDNTKDAAICPYCGTAFIVEKAINNYNTTNQIHAGTVNIYGGNSADFVIRGGVLEKYNGAATEVVVPNSVKIIGCEAFLNCIGITSVVLPDSVREIRDGSYERGAFAGCTTLISIVIPNSVQKIGSLAFKDCKSLTSVTIPDSVQTIGVRSFDGCGSLTSVNIPDSVQTIGWGAFSGCSSLTSVSIPSSVKRIDESAFEGCTALRKVKIDGNPEISSGTFGHTVFEKPDIQIVEASEEWKKKNWGAFKNEQQSRNGGCYVATAVYGSYDCPEVWTLRRFRDNMLDRTWYGRAFIRAYYAVSPTLVRWFGTTGWFRSLFKAPLDRFVRKLRQRGVQDTPYQDKY